MVPTTVNGIVLLLVLLVPGFIYVLRRETHTPSRKFSAFRETMRVVVASTFAYGASTLLVSWLSFYVPPAQRAGLTVLADPYEYQSAHPLRFAVSVIAFVCFTTVISALAGGTIPSRMLRWLSENGPNRTKAFFTQLELSRAPISSAWWTVFEQRPNDIKQVAARLQDGTVLTGQLYSYSQDAADSQDRDLVLQKPLFVQNPNSEHIQEFPGESVVISARELRFLTVTYQEQGQQAVV
jgi:hypothetical protein